MPKLTSRDKEPPNPLMWYVCMFCNRAFQEASKLIAHKKENHLKEALQFKRSKALLSDHGNTTKQESKVVLKKGIKEENKDTVSSEPTSSKKNGTAGCSASDTTKTSNTNNSTSTKTGNEVEKCANEETSECGSQDASNGNGTAAPNPPPSFSHSSVTSKSSSLPTSATMETDILVTPITNCEMALMESSVTETGGAVSSSEETLEAKKKKKFKEINRSESSQTSTEGLNPPKTLVPGSLISRWIRDPSEATSVIQCLLSRELYHQIGTKRRSESALVRHLNKQRAKETALDTKKPTTPFHLRSQNHRPSFEQEPFEVVTNNRADPQSRHLILETKTASSPQFDVMENQLYFLVTKSRPRMCFFDIKPGPHGSTRIAYTRKDPTIRKHFVAEDMDVFYINTASPDCTAPSLHNILVTIPFSQDRLILYDMENGNQVEEFVFNTEAFYHTLNCHSNGRIIVESQLKPSAGIFKEYLIFSYPPLRLEARVQILQIIIDQGGYRLVQVHAELVTLLTADGRFELCHLDELLAKSKLPAAELRDRPRVTHLVTGFPQPFLSVRAEYLVFGLPAFPAYYLIRDKSSYQVLELSQHGSVPINKNHLLELTDEDPKDLNPYFMTNTNTIVLVGKARVRILGIVCNDDPTFRAGKYRSGASLRVLLDKNFGTDAPETETMRQEPMVANPYSRRCRLLQRRPSFYSEDPEEFLLCYDDNHFLQQFVIVKFRADGITCFVYSSKTFELDYIIKSEKCRDDRLKIDKDLLDAEVTCHFTPFFIVVRYSRTESETKEHRVLFVFNLINAGEVDVI